MKNEKISPKVIERLTKYLRCLEEFDENVFISSEELADCMGYTAAQVRKDLSHFGEFGIRGKGYQVKELCNNIEDILGVYNKINQVVIVGVGRLGGALLSEREFTKESFHVVGLFDNSSTKIGKKVAGIKIQHLRELPLFVENNGPIDIAILTVPKNVANDVADFLIESGIRAILNFAPVKLNVPPGVVAENIDLYAKLQELNYWKNKSK